MIVRDMTMLHVILFFLTNAALGTVVSNSNAADDSTNDQVGDQLEGPAPHHHTHFKPRFGVAGVAPARHRRVAWQQVQQHLDNVKHTPDVEEAIQQPATETVDIKEKAPISQVSVEQTVDTSKDDDFSMKDTDLDGSGASMDASNAAMDAPSTDDVSEADSEPGSTDGGSLTDTRQELKETKMADQAAIESLNQQLAQVNHNAKTTAAEMNDRLHKAEALAHSVTKQLTGVASQAMHLRRVRATAIAKDGHLAHELAALESKAKAKEHAVQAKLQQELTAKENALKATQAGLHTAQHAAQAATARVSELQNQLANFTSRIAQEEAQEQEQQTEEAKQENDLKTAQKAQRALTSELVKERKVSTKEKIKQKALRKQVGKLWHSRSAQIRDLKNKLKTVEAKANATMRQMNTEWKEDRASDEKLIVSLKEKITMLQQSDTENDSAMQSEETIAQQDLSKTQAVAAKLAAEETQQKAALATLDAQIKEVTSQLKDEKELTEPLKEDVKGTQIKLKSEEPELSAIKVQEVQMRKSMEAKAKALATERHQLSSQLQTETLQVEAEAKKQQILSQANDTVQSQALLQSLKLQDLEAKAQDAKEHASSIFKEEEAALGQDLAKTNSKMSEAQKALELAKTKAKTQEELAARKLEELLKQQASLNSSLAITRAKITAEKRMISKSNSMLQSSKSGVDDTRKRVSVEERAAKQMEEETWMLKTQVSSMEARLADAEQTAKDRIADLETKSKAAWQQVANLQKHIKLATTNATQMSLLAGGNKYDSQRLTKEITAKSQKLTELHDEKQQLRERLTASILQEEATQKTVSSQLQEQKAHLSSSIKAAAHKRATQTQEAESQVDSLTNEHSGKASMLQDTTKQLQSFKSLAESRGAELEQKQAELSKLQHELSKSRKHWMTLSAALAARKEDLSDLQVHLNETVKVTNATKGRMLAQAMKWQKQHDDVAQQTEKAEVEANRTSHALNEAQIASKALKKALADKEHDIQEATSEEQKTLEVAQKQLHEAKLERRNQSQTLHKQAALIQSQLRDLHTSSEQEKVDDAKQIATLIEAGKRANATLQQTSQILKNVQSKALKNAQIMNQVASKLQAAQSQVNETIALHNRTLLHANWESQNLSAARALEKSAEANYSLLEHTGMALKEKFMNEAYELRVALNTSETPLNADLALLAKQKKASAIMQREIARRTKEAASVQEQEKQMLMNASVTLRTNLALEAKEQNQSHLQETQLMENIVDLKEKAAETKNYTQGNISLILESHNEVNASLFDTEQQLVSSNKQDAALAQNLSKDDATLKSERKLFKARESALNKVTKELKRVQNGIPKLQEKEDKLEQTINAKTSALQEKAQKDTADVAALQAKLKDVTANNTEAKGTLQKETKELKEMTHTMQTQLQDIQGQYKQQTQKIKSDAKEVQKLSKENKRVDKLLRNQTKTVNSMERKLDKKMQFVSDLQATVDSVQEQSKKTVEKLQATQEELRQAEKSSEQVDNEKQQMYEDIKKEKKAIIKEQQSAEVRAEEQNQTLVKEATHHREERWPLRKEVQKLQAELNFQRVTVRNLSGEVSTLSRTDESKEKQLGLIQQQLQQVQGKNKQRTSYLQQTKAQRDQISEELDHEHNATLAGLDELKKEKGVVAELHARITQQRKGATEQIHALHNQIDSEISEKRHWEKAANRSHANATQLLRELQRERHQMGSEMSAKGRALQDMRDQLSQTEEDFKERITSHIHRTNRSEARMRNNTARISYLQNEKRNAAATTQSLQQSLRKLKSESQQLHSKSQGLKEQERQLQEEYHAQKKKVHSLNQELEQQEDEINELKDNETRVLERANKTLSRERKSYHREITAGRKNVKELQEHIENATRRAENKMQQISQLQKTRKMLEHAVQKANAEVQATQEVVEKRKVFLQRQQSEIEQLGQQIDAEKNHTHQQHGLKQKAEHKIADLKDEMEQENTTAAHKEKVLGKHIRNLTREEHMLDHALNLSESKTRPEAEEDLRKMRHALQQQKAALQDAKDKDQGDLRNISNETAIRSRRLSALHAKGGRLAKALKESRFAVNNATKQDEMANQSFIAVKKHQGKLQQKLGALQTGLRRAVANSTALLLALKREEQEDATRSDSAADTEKHLRAVSNSTRRNLTRKLVSQRKALRVANSELQKVQNQNSVDQTEINKLSKQARSLQKQQETLAKQKAALQKGGQQLIAKFDLLRHQSAIINTRLVSDQNTIARQRKQNSIVEERNQGLSETGEALRSQLVGLKSDWQSEKGQTAVTARELSEQKEKMHSFQVENKVLKSLEDADKHEDDRVQDENKELRQKIADLMKKTADLSAERDATKKDVQEAEQARKSATMGSDSAYEEVAQLTGKGDTLKSKLQRILARKASVNKKLKELEENEGTDDNARRRADSLLSEAQKRHDAELKKLRIAEALLKKTQLRSKLAYNALNADQKRAVGQIPTHPPIAAAPVIPLAPLRPSSGFLQTAANPIPNPPSITPSTIAALSAALAPPAGLQASVPGPSMTLDEANKQASVPLAQLFPTPAPVTSSITAAFPSLPLPPPPSVSGSAANSAIPAPPGIPAPPAQSALGLALSHIGEGYRFQEAAAGSLTQEIYKTNDPLALARGDSTVETLINSAAKQ
eukprot:gnl/MRDRNA2_/MRDRNA2_51202_c0_seq1.p1 gnl/MRDRNA2_/MRDRNA2_51202_c0~~gnl/MRDRNA2_/MRDRNA2_51202_c0_seq1.p1  ORF type:complete len:2640 (-),score=854.51 gnl/MRDRNA2_/MRDRNA2_51202_c0_seq1:24-7943(-)